MLQGETYLPNTRRLEKKILFPRWKQ